MSNWDILNELFALLRDCRVVDITGQYYRRFGNDAPPKLLAESIRKLEMMLSRSPQGQPLTEPVHFCTWCKDPNNPDPRFHENESSHHQIASDGVPCDGTEPN